MRKFLSKLMTVLAVGLIAVVASGCKTSKQTEVKDKVLGGTQVQEKTVTEFGGKATVTEKKTDYNAQGQKEKTETKTTGDTGAQ